MNTHSRNNVVYLASYIRLRQMDGASPSSSAVRSEHAERESSTPRRGRRTRFVQEEASDDDLVEQIALGDLDAAARLRARHSDRLRRAATAILKEEDEAARVVEHALEEACSGWPPERGEVGPWLLKLVRRGALARRRVLHGERVPLDFGR
jgi:DNA-directed RNA polymerase specialized sigma24 family protein